MLSLRHLFRLPKPDILQGPLSAQVESNGRNAVLTVWGPSAWAAIPEAERPEASPMDRPGWRWGLTLGGPSEDQLAHWRWLASRGVGIDPETGAMVHPTGVAL